MDMIGKVISFMHPGEGIERFGIVLERAWVGGGGRMWLVQCLDCRFYVYPSHITGIED